MKSAARLQKIPPYLFAELDRKQSELKKRGVDVISLGVGDPDTPTPPHVIEALKREAEHSEWHRYPSYQGAQAFREAAATWLARRFEVSVDPDRETLALIGSKEGLAHIIWAFVDPDDVVLVPDPAYPVYLNQTLLAGGKPHLMPLTAERAFLPDLAAIPEAVAKRAKLLFLNYPNNPTAAVATNEFFQEAVDFCRRHEILLVHDAAYTEIAFDGFQPPSVLQVPGAKEVAIEFHSLSKPFNMTGWRLGFAAGNADAVQALASIKTHTDSGQFTAIQYAGIEALLNTPETFLAKMRHIYKTRRDLAVAALQEMGVAVEPPKATFYIWAPVPEGYTSGSFAEKLLTEAGVVVAPGSAYGPAGEGYFRISLSLADERLREALARIRNLSV